MRPRQNGRHFPDDIFRCIFSNESVYISIKISLKFVPKGPINNIPALVQIMAWRRSGDKPLSEPMTVSLPTHICVTRPQWVNLQRYLLTMVIWYWRFLLTSVNCTSMFPSANMQISNQQRYAQIFHKMPWFKRLPNRNTLVGCTGKWRYVKHVLTGMSVLSCVANKRYDHSCPLR